MCYEIIFDPNYKNSATYHKNLKILHPEAASEHSTRFDREYVILGEKVSIPPVTQPTSNKNLINMFNMILSHHFCKLPCYVYPTDHFEVLFEQSIGLSGVTADEYVKIYYENFKANDHAILVKDALVFPCNYGHTWHTVVVDKPMNSVTEGEICNVYLISTHNVIPQFAIAKVITKYMAMAFAAMSYKVIPENWKYHELKLTDYCNQAPVICCLYTELAFQIVKEKKDMDILFNAIKPEVFKLKMENYIFARYLQTLLNCFAVEHNEFGQIADFDVIMIELEDFVWNPITDIDRILNPNRQMRVIRPIRQFAPKRSNSPERSESS